MFFEVDLHTNKNIYVVCGLRFWLYLQISINSCLLPPLFLCPVQVEKVYYKEWLRLHGRYESCLQSLATQMVNLLVLIRKWRQKNLLIYFFIYLCLYVCNIPYINYDHYCHIFLYYGYYERYYVLFLGHTHTHKRIWQ